MANITFEQTENGIEELQFKLEPIDSTISVKTEFSLSVNQNDVTLLKLQCNLSLSGDDNEKNFMYIKNYGIYKTNNTDTELTLDKIDNAKELMEDLIPSVNEVLSFISKKGLGNKIELPENVPNAKDSSD
jgi:hypothetical protein